MQEGAPVKTDRVYFPVDAIAAHKDFEVWYEDADTFLTIKSTWASERDKVLIFGRMGGQMGAIKPDPRALVYYLKLERWEYALHTLRLFENYYVAGMRWDVNGTLSTPPVTFVNEDTKSKDVHVSVVKFKDKGPCFEVKAKDVAKLRIAVAAVIAMAIKEEYKGLSEGFKDPNASRWQKFKRWAFEGRGIPYEEL